MSVIKAWLLNTEIECQAIHGPVTGVLKETRKIKIRSRDNHYLKTPTGCIQLVFLNSDCDKMHGVFRIK
jgi:hypothetical protein